MERSTNVEDLYVIQFTHSLLQQLFQAVDVWSVPSLALHHHAVSVGRTFVSVFISILTALMCDKPGNVLPFTNCHYSTLAQAKMLSRAWTDNPSGNINPV